MSITLQSSFGHRNERQRFVAGRSCLPIFDSPAPSMFHVVYRVCSPASEEVVPRRGEEEEDSCSSSSSIGKNSDTSAALSDADDVGENEVQSSCKRSLHSMNALEEVLPIKRGVSKFYDGKSKSFTSLTDISSSFSIKDLAKPENAYSRKRKNLLANSIFFDKDYNHLLKSNCGGILKKSANSSRSTFAFAVNKSNSGGSKCSGENSNARSSSSLSRLPPLHPQGKKSPNSRSSSPQPLRISSPWRSFSLSDLQRVAAEEMMRANEI